MRKPLRVSVSRVQWINEQFQESGKDEVSIVGFGMTGLGQRIAIRPVSLGSYDAGDDRNTNLPTLIDTNIHDAEDLVSLCLWLFERDRGNLARRGVQLELNFNSALDAALERTEPLGLDAKPKHLYSFAQAMVSVRSQMQAYASDTMNNDDILPEHFQHLHPLLRLPPPFGQPKFEFQFIGNPNYRVICEYEFERVLLPA